MPDDEHHSERGNEVLHALSRSRASYQSKHNHLCRNSDRAAHWSRPQARPATRHQSHAVSVPTPSLSMTHAFEAAWLSMGERPCASLSIGMCALGVDASLFLPPILTRPQYLTSRLDFKHVFAFPLGCCLSWRHPEVVGLSDSMKEPCFSSSATSHGATQK